MATKITQEKREIVNLTQTSYGSFHCDVCGEEYNNQQLAYIHGKADHSAKKVTTTPFIEEN